MSLFSEITIYYAPDDVGGIPNSATPGATPPPRGVSPATKSIERHLQELSETNKRMYAMLHKSLGLGQVKDKESDEKAETLKEMFSEPFKEAFGDLKNIFNPKEMLSSLVGGDALLESIGISGLTDGAGGVGSMRPKERPKISDMLKLPVEHSMGYMLLYWKLDEIRGLLGGEDKKDGGGSVGSKIGGFFSGLLKGAGALALLAGALILFAGALFIFSRIEGSDWVRAIAGMAAFATFVIGAIFVAKLVGRSQKDFLNFAGGVALLAGSMIIFGVAIFVMAAIRPFIPAAMDGLELFTYFVIGAVILSRLVGDNLQHFVKFGLGILVLTASMILFAGAIFILNFIQPYVVQALPGVVLFTGFVLLMSVAARIVGNNLGNYVKFAVGTLILTFGLALFAGAVWIINNLITWEGLEMALDTVLVMGALVALAGGIGLLINALMPGLGGFIVGSVLLSLGMMLFGAAIRSVNEITLSQLGTATMVVAGIGALGAAAGVMGYGLLFVLPGLAAFAAAATLLSVGMSAFGRTIRRTADVADLVPIAMPALRQMMRFLSNPESIQRNGDEVSIVPGSEPGVLELLTLMGVGVLAKLALFGVALIPFSEGMTRFAATIQKVAEAGEYTAAGIIGLMKMMRFLSNPDGALDDEGNPIGAGAPGVLQLLDTVSGVTLIKLGAFGLALRPFSDSMGRFADVIKMVAEMGDDEFIGRGVRGVGNMIGLLVGGGPAGVDQADSVVGLMEHVRLRVAVRIAAFGAAFGPLASALLDFAHVIDFVADMEGKVEAAVPGLRIMFNFLVGDEDWTVASMIGSVERRISRNIGSFGAALEPFSSGLLTFAEVIERVKDFEGDIDVAISGLSKMVTFLGEAGQIADQVGSGGFFGLGRSNMDKFEDAITPLGTGVNSFLQIIRNMDGQGEAIRSAEGSLRTMVRMLTAAGGVTASTPVRNIQDFKTSLDALGTSINTFTGQIGGTTPFVLDRIADALERIAQIQFGNQFTPFIQFMSHNEQLKETATQLERINQAITPQQPNTLDRISGAIGSLFNRNRDGGGERTALDSDEVSSYVTTVDGSLEGYVAGMYDILHRWDQNPIALPAGGGDTNMLVVRSGSSGQQRQSGFGNY